MGDKRQANQQPAQPSGTAPQQQPRIAIPSFKDVQQAERQRQTAPNYFRPGASTPQTNAGTTNLQTANPLYFLDTSGGGPSSIRHNNPPSIPQNQPHYSHQYQQQQQQAYPRPNQPPISSNAYQHHNRPPPQVQYNYQQQQGYAPRPQQQQPNYNAPPPQAAAVQQQQQQAVLLPYGVNPNAIIVSKRQEGNPMLKYIRNVRWQFGDIVPDYVLGQNTAAIFISLRFHLLKPEYIFTRMKELARSYKLRVILCHVDTEDAAEPLSQVTRAAIGNDFTLICGFSNQECARYLETLKIYENKPAEVIQKDVGHDYLSRLNAALTTVRGVNKTDTKTLGDRFGSVASLFEASKADLLACPGIGSTKARRLFETFNEPFRKTAALPAVGSVEGAQQQQPAAAAGTATTMMDVDSDEEDLAALRATEKQQVHQQKQQQTKNVAPAAPGVVETFNDDEQVFADEEQEDNDDDDDFL